MNHLAQARRVFDLEIAALKAVRAQLDDAFTQAVELVVETLRQHKERLRSLYEEDRAANLPGVWLPEGLARKYPQAGHA